MNDNNIHLTPREWDVLKGMAQGLSLQETAEKLAIEPTTVKNFRTKIFEKLNVCSSGEAVAAGVKTGLLGPNDFLGVVGAGRRVT